MKRIILLFLVLSFSACSNTNNVAVTSTPAVTSILTPTPKSVETLEPTPRNIDLFNDTTCDAPCMLGISPGMTSEAEAKETVRNNDLVTDCVEEDLTPQGGKHWIYCHGFNTNLHIYFQDNMVIRISFSQSDLTIEQIIQKYGMPDALKVKLFTMHDAPLMSSMVLRYNKIQMLVALTLETNEYEYEVKPTNEILQIDFYSEQEFKASQELYQDSWRGYGIYQVSN